jgi:hypothetical protein
MSLDKKSSNTLLLGMFYSKFSKKNLTWSCQMPRDRIRCLALEKHMNMNIFTLDNKHSTDEGMTNKHCQANFSDPKRLSIDLEKLWSNNHKKIEFDNICLDYFFSPQGWAGDRWTNKFFTGTIPFFATNGWLKLNGSIWLPNIKYVSEKILEHEEILSKYFLIEFTSDPSQNPLFKATDLCKKELESCIDIVTNDNELPKLLVASKFPFVKLTSKTSECNIKDNKKRLLDKTSDNHDKENVTNYNKKTSPKYDMIL